MNTIHHRGKTKGPKSQKDMVAWLPKTLNSKSAPADFFGFEIQQKAGNTMANDIRKVSEMEDGEIGFFDCNRQYFPYGPWIRIKCPKLDCSGFSKIFYLSWGKIPNEVEERKMLPWEKTKHNETVYLSISQKATIITKRCQACGEIVYIIVESIYQGS